MDSVHEMISKRAYERFLARGGVNGYAIQDWVEAEKEIYAKIDKERKATAQSKTEKKEPVKQSAPAVEKVEVSKVVHSEPVKATTEKNSPAKKTVPTKKAFR